MATNPFLLQRYAAQSAGIAIVRNVIEKNVFPGGYFTTKELYRLAIQEPPPPKFEPYPLKSPTQNQPDAVIKSKKKRQFNAPPARLASLNHPEHPEHPIRSIRFLKEYVLPHLEGNKEVQMRKRPAFVNPDSSDSATTKTQATGSHTKFAWKVIPPEERPTKPAPPAKKEVVGTEIGVGEDFSHLNKRRRAARVGKISAQVDRLKTYKSHTETRDPILERIGTNPVLLHKVHQWVSSLPRLNLDDIAQIEKKAQRRLPGARLSTTPVEGEDLTKLEAVQRHLAFNRTAKPSNVKPRTGLQMFQDNWWSLTRP